MATGARQSINRYEIQCLWGCENPLDIVEDKEVEMQRRMRGMTWGRGLAESKIGDGLRCRPKLVHPKVERARTVDVTARVLCCTADERRRRGERG